MQALYVCTHCSLWPHVWQETTTLAASAVLPIGRSRAGSMGRCSCIQRWVASGDYVGKRHPPVIPDSQVEEASTLAGWSRGLGILGALPIGIQGRLACIAAYQELA